MERNGRLSRLVALLLLPLGLLLSAGSAAGAQNNGADTVPDYDYVMIGESTPDYQGWQRYLPSARLGPFSGSWRLLGSNGELVFILGPFGLEALDIADGESRWTLALEIPEYTRIAIYRDDYIVLQDWQYCIAVNLLDGSERWQLQGQEAIGAGAGGVWTTQLASQYSYGSSRRSELQLRDAANGKLIREFPAGPIYALPQSVPNPESVPYRSPAMDTLAIWRGNELQCYDPAGLRWSFAAKDELSSLELHMLPEGLLVVEFMDSDRIYDFSKEDSEIGRRALALWEENTSRWGFQTQGLELYLLDPEDGEPVWTIHSDLYYNYNGERLLEPGSFSSMMRSYESIPGDDGMPTYRGFGLQLRNSDGALLQELPAGVSVQGQKNLYVSAKDDFAGDWQLPLFLVDDTGQALPLELPCRSQFGTCISVGNRILYVLRHNEDWNFIGSSEVLHCVELDSQAQWLAGDPIRRNWPQRDYSLTQRFLESTDPLADDALMGGLQQQGITAFAIIAERIDELSPQQLRALGELAMQQEQRRDCLDELLESQWSMFSGGGSYDWVTPAVIRAARPEIIPVLIDWHTDSRFSDHIEQIVGLIAVCGGDQARRYLEAYYRRNMRDAPDPGRAEPGVVAQLFAMQDGDLRQETALELRNGSRLQMYVNERLGSPVVCLAIDNDADGIFDEFLPTGLGNICLLSGEAWKYELQFDREYLPEVPAGIALSDGADDEVLLSHYRLPGKLAELEYEEIEEDMPPRGKLVNVRLNLTELRRDSDADGLTDVAEGYLLTDPGNGDTDGDGLPDNADRYPNDEAGVLTELERGVRRLVVRVQIAKDEYISSSRSWPDRLAYINMEPEVPVIMNFSPASVAIVIDNEEQRLRLEELHNRYRPLEPSLLDVMPPADLLKARFILPYNGWGYGKGYSLIEIDGELYPGPSPGGDWYAL